MTSRVKQIHFILNSFSACQNECLIWPYAKNSRGYARVQHCGKWALVHRLICTWIYGAAPSDKHHAAHSCGKGHLGCINWKHLVWKTPSENEHDKIGHGTSNRGERCGSNKLTKEQVIEIRGSNEHPKILAARFNVHWQHIRSLRRGKFWPELNPNISAIDQTNYVPQLVAQTTDPWQQ